MGRNTKKTFRHVAFGLGLAALLSGGTALAQAPTPPANPLDNIPEAMPFNIPYGAPVTAEQARTVIAAGVAEAKKRNWALIFTVMDSGGNLVAFERMDGAMLASIPISQKKALASVQLRRETKVAEAAIQAGNNYLITIDQLIGSRGGIPLVLDGKIIGSIGVSGGTGSQDEVAAKAAAAALK